MPLRFRSWMGLYCVLLVGCTTTTATERARLAQRVFTNRVNCVSVWEGLRELWDGRKLQTEVCIDGLVLKSWESTNFISEEGLEAASLAESYSGIYGIEIRWGDNARSAGRAIARMPQNTSGGVVAEIHGFGRLIAAETFGEHSLSNVRLEVHAVDRVRQLTETEVRALD